MRRLWSSLRRSATRVTLLLACCLALAGCDGGPGVGGVSTRCTFTMPTTVAGVAAPQFGPMNFGCVMEHMLRPMGRVRLMVNRLKVPAWALLAGLGLISLFHATIKLNENAMAGGAVREENPLLVAATVGLRVSMTALVLAWYADGSPGGPVSGGLAAAGAIGSASQDVGQYLMDDVGAAANRSEALRIALGTSTIREKVQLALANEATLNERLARDSSLSPAARAAIQDTILKRTVLLDPPRCKASATAGVADSVERNTWFAVCDDAAAYAASIRPTMTEAAKASPTGDIAGVLGSFSGMIGNAIASGVASIVGAMTGSIFALISAVTGMLVAVLLGFGPLFIALFTYELSAKMGKKWLEMVVGFSMIPGLLAVGQGIYTGFMQDAGSSAAGSVAFAIFLAMMTPIFMVVLMIIGMNTINSMTGGTVGALAQMGSFAAAGAMSSGLKGMGAAREAYQQTGSASAAVAAATRSMASSAAQGVAGGAGGMAAAGAGVADIDRLRKATTSAQEGAGTVGVAAMQQAAAASTAAKAVRAQGGGVGAATAAAGKAFVGAGAATATQQAQGEQRVAAGAASLQAGVDYTQATNEDGSPGAITLTPQGRAAMAGHVQRAQAAGVPLATTNPDAIANSPTVRAAIMSGSGPAPIGGLPVGSAAYAVASQLTGVMSEGAAAAEGQRIAGGADIATPQHHAAARATARVASRSATASDGTRYGIDTASMGGGVPATSRTYSAAPGSLFSAVAAEGTTTSQEQTYHVALAQARQSYLPREDEAPDAYSARLQHHVFVG